MKHALGALEARFFAYLQLRRQQIVRTGDLRGALRLSTTQERELLSRLERGGLIVRLQRGLYLAPSRLPLGGTWAPTDGQILEALARGLDLSYQISGPAAFNFHGWTEQVPQVIHVYNDRISGSRTIGARKFEFVRLASERLGDTESIAAPDESSTTFSSRPRALVDAVHDWSRFGSIPKAYDWIRNDLKTERVTAQTLARAAIRFANVSARRRIGFVLESCGAPARSSRALSASLPGTTSPIPLDPSRPKRGRIERTWGVVVNDGKE